MRLTHTASINPMERSVSQVHQPTTTPDPRTERLLGLGEFLDGALTEKLGADAAAKVADLLLTPTRAFSAEQEAQRKIAGQLTRNVVAIGESA